MQKSVTIQNEGNYNNVNKEIKLVETTGTMLNV